MNRRIIIPILILLISLSLSQEFQWARMGHRPDGNNGVYTDGAITTDPNGNVYIAGRYYAQTFGDERAHFDGHWLPGYNPGAFQEDLFFVSYDTDGNIRWANRAGSPGGTFERPHGAAYYDNNVYFTGRFVQTFHYGSTSSGVTSYGGEDMFLAKYSGGGVFQWVVNAGGTSSDQGRGIAISNSGEIYVVGIFNGIATFGSHNVTSTMSGGFYVNDIFLAKYNTSGVCQWVRRMGGTGYDYGNDVSVAPDGSVYVTGYFQNTADFGSFNLTSAGSTDLFVAKYNSSGTCLWVRQGSCTESVYGNGIATDGTNVYVSGWFGNANMTVGGTTLINGGGTDAFLLNYNTAGTLQWGRVGSSTETASGRRCAVDAMGNGYIIGLFDGTATFEDTSITNAGGSHDIFIACYSPVGDLIYLKYAGGTHQAWGAGITIGDDGYAYCTGTIFGFPVTTFHFDDHTLDITRNGVWTAKLSPPPIPYVDIGLKIHDGTRNVTIACEPGPATSRLRIAKDGLVYGVALVDPSDPNASRVRIATPDGVRALREF